MNIGNETVWLNIWKATDKLHEEMLSIKSKLGRNILKMIWSQRDYAILMWNSVGY